MGEPEQKNLVNLMMDISRRNEDLKDALKNIFMNTIHLEDCMFKHGVLTNIKMVIDEDTYQQWEALYG